MRPHTTTIIKISFLLLLSISFKASYAQDTVAINQKQQHLKDSLSDMLSAIKNDPNGKGKFPKTVLAQLNTEQNRIKALTKDKKYKLVEEVKEDALAVRHAMITDFKENFDYCPVYYFMDTDIDLIKNEHFEGVLMNADGSLAHNVPHDNYVIAYYGYLSAKYKKHQNKEDSLRRVTDAEIPYGRGLLVTDGKLNVLTYFYKEGYDEIRWGLKSVRPDLHYTSKHFDIEYYPFVKLFNIKLVKRQFRLEFFKNYIMYMFGIHTYHHNEKIK